MKTHPREFQVRTAGNALEKAMLGVLEVHKDLTVNETIQIINHAAYSLIGHITKMEIRMERHGDYEKQGGLTDDDDEDGK